MRVLYVSHFAGLGGAERSLLELIGATRTLNVEPLLLCPPGPLTSAAEERGIPSVHWRAHTVRRTAAAAWRALQCMPGAWKALRDVGRRFEPDVVHVNSLQAMLWCAPATAAPRTPLVWHWRDFHDQARLVSLLSRSADAIVAISDSIRRVAAAQLHAAARIVLVRNGIADFGEADDDGAGIRDRFGIPREAQLVVMAGQSIPRKGHPVLVRALRLLAARRTAVHGLLLCSEHDEETAAHTVALRQQVRDSGCQSFITVAGSIDPIAPVLRAADVVAVPSFREPFGRIAVEAMFARRPVVASAVDGLNEIVEEGVTGFLVAPGDPESLALALQRVLDDAPAWRRRGFESRRRALARFSVVRAATETVSLYDSLLAANHAHRC